MVNLLIFYLKESLSCYNRVVGDLCVMRNLKIYLTNSFYILAISICPWNFNNSVAGDKKTEAINVDASAEKPKIVFEEQKYDFGKIYIGDNIKHKFKFKNLGSGELIISNVKSSCGCTAALVTKNKLLKNEEGEVEIRFNPGSFVGRVTKSVVVNSNDQENPSYRLVISGEVVEEVSVNPKRVNFGIIRKGDICTKALEVKTIPEFNIKLKKVESPNTYITVTEDKTNEDNSYRYQITFSNYDYLGKFNGIIFVYTSSDKQERIDIPFSGEIIGDITFYPETVSFGTVKKNQNTKKTLIVNFVNKDVMIEKIEVNPGAVYYTISDLNKNSKQIDFKLDEDIEIGKITGNIKIYTNSNVQPIINIPIRGEVKG